MECHINTHTGGKAWHKKGRHKCEEIFMLLSLEYKRRKMENQDNLKSKSIFSKVDSSQARKVEF